MKKSLKLITFMFISLMCLMPLNVNAAVEMTNFKETVDFEVSIYDGIEGYEDIVANLKAVDFSNYKSTNDKVNVYIFRGSTCGFCLKAIEYFASIYDEYGQYFDLKTYEVWGNEDNGVLMDSLAKKVGVNSVDGVPFIIIGDKHWGGFTEAYADDMINEIMKQYDSDDRYDVMLAENDNNDVVVIITVGTIAVLVVGLLVFAKVKNK